jgi:hypothetical protein
MRWLTFHPGNMLWTSACSFMPWNHVKSMVKFWALPLGKHALADLPSGKLALDKCMFVDAPEACKKHGTKIFG